MDTSLTAEPDTDLLRAHRAGHPSALGSLYARYRVPTYAYLLRRCGGEQAEASFRALWRAVASGERLHADHGFVAQLFGLAHAEAERAAPGDAITPDSTLPEATQRTRQRARRFERSLRQVSPRSREAYLLYEEGGLTLAEVGRILDMDTVEARQRIQDALAELRAAFDAPGDSRPALHDPLIAAAHLAARPTPSRTLDAAVLDDARRAAAVHAEQQRRGRGGRRAWPYLVGFGVLLAIAPWMLAQRERAALPPAPAVVAPPPAPVAFDALPVADPVQAPKTVTVTIGPKPAAKATATPRPKKRMAPPSSRPEPPGTPAPAPEPITTPAPGPAPTDVAPAPAPPTLPVATDAPPPPPSGAR